MKFCNGTSLWPKNKVNKFMISKWNGFLNVLFWFLFIGSVEYFIFALWKILRISLWQLIIYLIMLHVYLETVCFIRSKLLGYIQNRFCPQNQLKQVWHMKYPWVGCHQFLSAFPIFCVVLWYLICTVIRKDAH